MAAEQPVASEETPVVEEEAAPKIPTLGKIIPLAAELSLQLAVLRKDLAAGLDVSPVEKSLSVSEANLKDFQAQLEKLKASEERTTYQLVQFNNTLGHEIQILNDSGKPLDDEIERFGLERERWIQSKNSWIELQSIYSEDDYYDELKPTFDNAQITIVAALELLREHLSELLAVQHRSGLVLAGINRLTVEVDSMIVRVPVDDLTESSPPMFSYLTACGMGLCCCRRSLRARDGSWLSS
jgi:hypothetical protein